MSSRESTMDVQVFVSTMLTQIVAGVDDARRNVSRGTIIAPAVHPKFDRVVSGGSDAKVVTNNVEFDIAVTVSEAQSRDGSAGLKVVGMGIGIGGKVGSETAAESISRIRFTVPLAFSGV